MRLLRRKKARPESVASSLLILAFTLAVGLLVGVVFGEAAFWCHGPNCQPGYGVALVRDPDRANSQPIAGDNAAECVPALVRDDSKEADVFTQMTDKALDLKAKVTTADRWFSVDANAGVAGLTVVLNPPLTVPPGTPVPAPQPRWDRTNVHTTAAIVCTVQGNGQCTPSVRADAYAPWDQVLGASSIGVRAEYDQPRFDEVRVRFQVKAAIDGGAVNGAGVFPLPPAGAVTFTKNDKTVAPEMGEARWHCVWLL